MNRWLPGPHEVVREGIIVLGGVILAAFVLSRLPTLKAWVTQQSLTVNDGKGNATAFF